MIYVWKQIPTVNVMSLNLRFLFCNIGNIHLWYSIDQCYQFQKLPLWNCNPLSFRPLNTLPWLMLFLLATDYVETVCLNVDLARVIYNPNYAWRLLLLFYVACKTLFVAYNSFSWSNAGLNFCLRKIFINSFMQWKKHNYLYSITARQKILKKTMVLCRLVSSSICHGVCWLCWIRKSIW